MKYKTLFILPLFLLSACGTKATNNNSNNPEPNVPITPAQNKDFTGVSFRSQTVNYDGQPHILSEVVGAPQGTTITYTGRESHVEVGVYPATALLQKDGYNDKTLSAALTIKEPIKEFTDAKMEDSTVTYDGEQHTIAPTGYPEGTTVTYIGTSKNRNAGTYTIKCKLTKTGYNPKELSATLTIEKAPIEGVTFEDEVVCYDGNEHSITVKNAPSGSSVSYQQVNGTGQNSFTAIGEYEVQATITKSNYETLTLTATLTIMGFDAVIGVDESKEAYQLDDELMWDDIFPELLKGNYTLDMYSGTRSSEDAPIEKPTDPTEVACDGANAFEHYHSTSSNYDDYQFYMDCGEDAVYRNIRINNYERDDMAKFPARAMGETEIKYYPARAFNALQKWEDGTVQPSVDGDDFYSDIGSYTVKDNHLFIKHEHKRDNNFIYEIYEFYNIGNTKLNIPTSLFPSQEVIDGLGVYNDFCLDGIKYGTHLVSTYNSPLEYMAHTYLHYYQLLILEPGVHTVLPEIYGRKVQRVVWRYHSEVNAYNYDMNGYELNYYFDQDGVYQGDYADLGEVADKNSKFTQYGGIVHYYGEW